MSIKDKFDHEFALSVLIYLMGKDDDTTVSELIEELADEAEDYENKHYPMEEE